MGSIYSAILRKVKTYRLLGQQAVVASLRGYGSHLLATLRRLPKVLPGITTILLFSQHI